MDKNQTGIDLMREGKWEEAAKAFAEAIEEQPKDPVAYINFGNVLTAVGDTERAMNFYDKAIDLDENAPAAYYSKGGVYFDQQNFAQAKSMFELALKKGLETGDNFFMLGMSLANMETASWHCHICSEALNFLRMMLKRISNTGSALRGKTLLMKQ